MNRITFGLAAGVGLTALLAGALAAPISAQSTRTARHNKTTLSAGTVIPVKLDEALNSKNASEGDTFTATVTSVDDYRDAASLPRGTKVDGVVRKVRAQEGKNPGMLDLDFKSVTLPDGTNYGINGSPIGLDKKSVVMKNGRLVAKPGKKGPNRLTYVGIGAGAGLLINVLGHRKGTLTDVLIGAGLGYAAGSLIKNGDSPRDVNLKAGTTLGVQLERSLALRR